MTTTRTHNDGVDLRQAYRDWLNELDVRCDYGITLTLKKGVIICDWKGYEIYKKIDRNIAEKVAEDFMRRLNRKALGRSHTQFGNSLFFIPVIESSVAGDFHLHFAIGSLPRHIDFCSFKVLFNKARQRLEWIDNQIDVDINQSKTTEFYNSRLINYLTKTIRNDCDDNLLLHRLWGKTIMRCGRH